MLSLDVHLQMDDFGLDVTTDIASSGVTALFGPSASGKTTLLRSIAGFEKCTGRIAFDADVWLDESVNLKPYKRPVGYVFQETRLFPHLSVQDNLRYAQTRRRRPGTTRDTTREREIGEAEVVHTLDLQPLLSRRPLDLSGGEAKRVALARTLLSAPKLLLLDEPLSGLDQSRKREILPYLERICAEYELPTLFVSHAVEEVARLADQVVALQHGQVKYAGNAADFLQSADTQPLTPVSEAGVAYEAEVTAIDQKLVSMTLVADNRHFVAPALDRFKVGAQTRLFIRARDVSIATQKPQQISIRNVLAATVERIDADETGPYAEVYLRLDQQILHARITRLALGDLGLFIGQSVFALVKSVSFDG